MNNSKYLNMSDKELIAYILIMSTSLQHLGDEGWRVNTLREAATELDLRVNRS